MQVQAPDNEAFEDSIALGITECTGGSVTKQALHETNPGTIHSSDLVIVAIEAKEAFLLDMSDEQITQLKQLISNSSRLVWLTGGGLRTGLRPDFAPALGFLRTLESEQPSLKSVMLDFDIQSKSETEALLPNLTTVTRKLLEDSADLETEYLQHHGTLHCGRITPNKSMNDSFKSVKKVSISTAVLKNIEQFELDIQETGQLDTTCFQELARNIEPLDNDSLEIEVKAVGVNAKDIHVMSARVEVTEQTCALELAGIVTRSTSSDFSPGDRVISMVPHSFRKYERVPAWACQKLQDGEDYNVLVANLVAFSTAIYGLRYRAQLQPGESVLIHSEAGAVGLAAIQIAQFLEADVYATVGKAEKKAFLTESGVLESHILNSRDSSFAEELLAQTQGKGVDVILNSLTDDLLSDGWNLCSGFGRFVEIGKKDITGGSRLDMEKFRDSTTFTAFDLTSLFYSKEKRYRQIWSSLVAEVLRLLRAQKIQPIKPLQCFDISRIHDAFRCFQAPNRMGKIVVSLNDPESLIPSIPQKYRSSFNPRKTYILFGCLGGVGRAISRWMFQQGARRFVFLSRSGASKLEAATLVSELQRAGACVDVVHGDVTVLEDVQAAVQKAREPLGGIVQASMCLEVGPISYICFFHR